jgi:hypothetical protein
MRLYDVSHGQQRLATVTVHDDGQITWEYSPDASQEHNLSADTKTVMEEALTLAPTAQVLTVRGLTMRQRLP